MNTRSWLAALAAGAIIGVVAVVACSDDAPGNADAATCDCPAAEPPLPGRIVSRTATGNIAPGSVGAASVQCPAGGVILGGGCSLLNADSRTVLQESKVLRSGGGAAGFVCTWYSGAAAADTGTAEAICLMPAQ